MTNVIARMDALIRSSNAVALIVVVDVLERNVICTRRRETLQKDIGNDDAATKQGSSGASSLGTTRTPSPETVTAYMRIVCDAARPLQDAQPTMGEAAEEWQTLKLLTPSWEVVAYRGVGKVSSSASCSAPWVMIAFLDAAYAIPTGEAPTQN